MMTATNQREVASRVQVTGRSNAMTLSHRLAVPFCEGEAQLRDALARFIVKSSAGHVPANRLKAELLAPHSIASLVERYGLPADTLRTVRDLLMRRV
jgi:hypothetical protein